MLAQVAAASLLCWQQGLQQLLRLASRLLPGAALQGRNGAAVEMLLQHSSQPGGAKMPSPALLLPLHIDCKRDLCKIRPAALLGQPGAEREVNVCCCLLWPCAWTLCCSIRSDLFYVMS